EVGRGQAAKGVLVQAELLRLELLHRRLLLRLIANATTPQQERCRPRTQSSERSRHELCNWRDHAQSRVQEEEVTMLLRTHALNLSLVIVAAAALPAHASDPPTSVRWGAIASGCTVDTSAALANVDASHGTVTFANGKSGHIKLTCPIPSAFVPSVWPFANDLTLTFYNDRGFVNG